MSPTPRSHGSNGVLGMVLAACLGIIVTGLSAWLAFGRDSMTRKEIAEYVHEQGPWPKARGEILSSISANARAVSSLQLSIDKVIDQQQALLVEQRVMLTKFDQYLKQERK